LDEMRHMNPGELPPPVGQYSNVAVMPAGAATAHVAGQLPVDDEGRVVGETFAEQADRVFDLLATALEGCGSSLARVAFIRAFMVDPDDFVGFRDARARAFSCYGVDSPPPATTIVVRGLYGGSLIELDAVASVTDGRT
jgi:2-iminobutanoate/2-iminopropanoate deaminase